MTSLSVLGCTGSVGQATLDVVRSRPDVFRVVALAAGRNLEVLRRQIAEHRPILVSVASSTDAAALRTELPGVEIVAGKEGLDLAARHPEAELVVSALVGTAGLEPTVAAIRAGKDVALANKESLVVAGELVMTEVERAEIRLRPVDSEHSALGQILRGRAKETVDRLILTASGGPFRTWTRQRMADATVEQALAHPTWSMGPKISVDSATLVNKGLEVIEAHHLFGVAEDRIDVVVHPQSVVHSLVAFTDGTLLAQLAANDMRIPIAHALGHPGRPRSTAGHVDLTRVARLDFAAPDTDRFPALGLARASLRAAGEMPAVFNAANEVAVATFLARGCPFDRIAATIDAVMNRWNTTRVSITTVEQALAVDGAARRLAAEVLGIPDPTSAVPRW